MLSSTFLLALASSTLALTSIDTPAYITAAVHDETRPAEDVVRDEGRKPGEVLAVAGIKPGDHVIDLIAGGGYYTRILSAAVGDMGHVYAQNDVYVATNYPQAVTGMEALAAERENITSFVCELYELDTAEALNGEQVDAVFMVLYYHDLLLQDVDRAAINQSIYNALKPGGTFLVVDHHGADDIDRDGVDALHRMAETQAIEEITAAGFVLETDSDILAHSEDDHTQNVFADGLRGKTDRFVHVYRKPM
ncbi:class I SAM-dependent methyltransferase [Woodsholea maritima]|uniref:class I SAM-dependent methyltransferase n=1 Tax=Woodsholea maritima TaxID=240237 RepID=UPI00036A4CAF|nr:class I SAM-dependent methyltransferase [Woodsholea maritima]